MTTNRAKRRHQAALNVRPETVKEIRVLAGRGLTDPEIATHVRLSREWIGDIRRAHHIPAVRHSAGGGGRRPKRTPTAEVRRSWDLAIAVHRAQPTAGVCSVCDRPRWLLPDGLLAPHMSAGRMCERSFRPPTVVD